MEPRVPRNFIRLSKDIKNQLLLKAGSNSRKPASVLINAVSPLRSSIAQTICYQSLFSLTGNK